MKVIFIPGLLCSDLVWGELNRLRNIFTCYDADTSFGAIEESANHILNQIKNVEDVVAIGISMGGSVAIDLALKLGDKLKKLVLINTTCHPVNPKTIPDRKKAIELVKQHKMAEVLELQGNFHYFKPKKEWFDLEKKMAEKIGAEAYVRQQNAIMNRKDYSSLIEQIKCDTLIVSTKEDKVLPYQDSIFMFEKMPNANLVLLSKCGHLSTIEQGNLVFDSVLSFLKH